MRTILGTLIPLALSGCIGPCAGPSECREVVRTEQANPLEADPPFWLDRSKTALNYDDQRRLVESVQTRYQGEQEFTERATWEYGRDGEQELRIKRSDDLIRQHRRVEHRLDKQGRLVDNRIYVGDKPEPASTILQTWDNKGRLELLAHHSASQPGKRFCTQHLHHDLDTPDDPLALMDYARLSCTRTVVQHFHYRDQELFTWTDRDANSSIEEVRHYVRDDQGNAIEELVSEGLNRVPTKRILREWTCD
jgi:hypothetical protein